MAAMGGRRAAILLLAFLALVSTVAGQSGSCPDGFSGPQCGVCASDAACVSSTANQQAVCSHNVTYASNSVTKSYSCEMSTALLASIVRTNSTYMTCHTGAKAGEAMAPSGAEGNGTLSSTTAPAPAPESEGVGSGTCDIGFTINSTSTAVACTATGCSFAAGSPDVYCTAVSCACPGAGGCPAGLVSSMITSVDGTATMQCSTDGTCSIAMQGLPIASIDVQCAVGECLVPVVTPLNNDTNAPVEVAHLDVNPIVAAVPLMVLLALSVFIGAYAIVHRGLWRAPREWARLEAVDALLAADGPPAKSFDAHSGGAAAAAGATLGAASGLPATTADTTRQSSSLRIETLSFHNLGVTVGMAPRLVAKKRAALRSKAVRRAQTMHVLRVHPPGENGALTAVLRAARRRLGLDSDDIEVPALFRSGGQHRTGTGGTSASASRRGSEARERRVTDPGADEPKLRERWGGGGGGSSVTFAALPDDGSGGGDAGTNGGAKTGGVDSAAAGFTALAASFPGLTSTTHAESAADYVADLHAVQGSADRWCILEGVSGELRGGQVVGVLGPSGCGKTTLLSCVAGAAFDLGRNATQSGQVCVDGQRRSRTRVAYVPQSDVLIPSLTVAECLRYSALLRLPRTTSPAEIAVRVDHAIDELGLRHVADGAVGGPGCRGVSGGERRRVTIGMELVTDPGVLVLDEPTSGLDSHTALALVRTLRSLAARGRVVLASLHQPSADMMGALDGVMLMAHGRLLFAGSPAEAPGWLAARGLPCPPGTALAEHMLALASDPADVRTILELQAKECACAGVVVKPPELLPLQQDGFGKVNDDEGTDDASPSASGDGSSPGTVVAGDAVQSGPPSPPAFSLVASVETPVCKSGGSGDRLNADVATADGTAIAAAPAATTVTAPRAVLPGFSRQLAVLTWRSGVDILRNPSLLRLHLVVGALMGLVTGAVFWQLDYSNVGVQNRMGGTFFALAFLAFTSLTTVDLLINEREVVAREVRGGYYRTSAYLLSKITLDAVLLRALPALLYWASFYHMAGFRTGAAYQLTYLFCLMTFSCAVGALSMCVTIGSGSAGEASFIMNFLILICIMFTGFLVNVNSIPGFLRWIHYLSIFFYAFEAMITNEMTGRTFSFNAAGYDAISGIKGDVYLATLGYDNAATTRDIGVLVGMWGGFTLLAFALMALRMPRGMPAMQRIIRRLTGKTN